MATKATTEHVSIKAQRGQGCSVCADTHGDVPQLTMVRVIRSISCLSLVLCCRKGLCLWWRGQKGLSGAHPYPPVPTSACTLTPGAA